MFILLIGWFGFNAGSTLGVTDGRFAEVAMVTMLGAAGGILGAYIATVVLQRTVDIGMVCNGLIAGLVAITAGSGYVENWAAPVIGLVGGLIVVPSILAIDRKLDDPVGVLSAHGLAGIWGTLACGLFTAPRFAQYAGDRQPGRRPRVLGLVRAARLPGARRGRRVRARARRSASAPGTRSPRRSGCASAPRPRWPASTSPSTACTATRSSSSPTPSSTAWPPRRWSSSTAAPPPAPAPASSAEAAPA